MISYRIQNSKGAKAGGEFATHEAAYQWALQHVGGFFTIVKFEVEC